MESMAEDKARSDSLQQAIKDREAKEQDMRRAAAQRAAEKKARDAAWAIRSCPKCGSDMKVTASQCPQCSAAVDDDEVALRNRIKGLYDELKPPKSLGTGRQGYSSTLWAYYPELLPTFEAWRQTALTKKEREEGSRLDQLEQMANAVRAYWQHAVTMAEAVNAEGQTFRKFYGEMQSKFSTKLRLALRTPTAEKGEVIVIGWTLADIRSNAWYVKQLKERSDVIAADNKRMKTVEDFKKFLKQKHIATLMKLNVTTGAITLDQRFDHSNNAGYANGCSFDDIVAAVGRPWVRRVSTGTNWLTRLGGLLSQLIGWGLLVYTVCYPFMYLGDFEVQRDGVNAYEAPSLTSAICEETEEGDLMDCVMDADDACISTDRLDGRWVQVEVDNLIADDQECWMHTDALREQPGYWVGIWYATVGDEDDLLLANQNAAVKTEAQKELMAETASLHSAGDWEGLARVAAEHVAFDLSSNTVLMDRFKEAKEQLAYTAKLSELRGLSNPDAIIAGVEALRAQTYPKDKADLTPIEAKARGVVFARDVKAAPKIRDLGERAQAMAALYAAEYPSDKSALKPVVVDIVGGLEKLAKRKPDSVVRAAKALRDTEGLLDFALAGSGDSAGLRASLDAALDAAIGKHKAGLLKKIKANTRNKPAVAGALLCELRELTDGPGVEIPADIDDALDKALESKAGKRAKAYLSAIGKRSYGTWRTFEKGLMGGGDVKRKAFKSDGQAWLDGHSAADPKGLRLKVASVASSECHSQAEVMLTDGTRKLSVKMRWEAKKWFPAERPKGYGQ